MSQLCFITQDEELAARIGRSLPEHTTCRTLSIVDADHELSVNDRIHPAMLIVDLQVFSPVLRGLLDRFSRAHPETTVICLASVENRDAARELVDLGVDEVMARPLAGQPSRHLIEALAQRIAVVTRVVALQTKLRKELGECQIVARSRAMHDIMQQLPKLANSLSTVLITGETGTGKELISRAIHYLGPRAGHPFVTIDCGTIPEHLVENELFGHARGAYTDAASAANGLIQEADGGTLFLDEVEAMPLSVQAKFLRFLQERQYRPLGQARYVTANVRVLAATNLDLAVAVRERRFRADLYYRLSVVPLRMPALRLRKADIPALVQHFVCRHTSEPVSGYSIPKEIMRSWMAYDWPGNVRELENKVQTWLTVQRFESGDKSAACAEFETSNFRTLAVVRQEALTRCEQTYLHELLAYTKGNISAAARLAGIHRKNLHALLARHGIDARRFRR